MRCRTARRLLDLHLDGELTNEQVPLLMEHLAQCPRCAEEHRKLERQEAVLRQVLPRSEPTAAQIEDGIARVAAELARGLRPAPRRRPPLQRWAWGAALLVCVLVASFLWRRGGSPLPPSIKVADTGSVVLSRDGQWVAFAAPDGLYVRQLPQGTAQRVAAGRCSEPTWSPRGDQLAYLIQEGAKKQLAVVELATRQRRVLWRGKDGEFPAHPQWAPRGPWILMVRHTLPPRHEELWLLHAERGITRKVDDLGRAPSHVASWAYDAGHFAYVRWPDEAHAELAIGRPDGRTWHVDGLGSLQEPQVAWAPDRTRLLYVKGAGERDLRSLILWAADGSRRVLATSGRLTDPAWSPSGTQICYARPHSLATGQAGLAGPSLTVMTSAGEPVTRMAGGPAGSEIRRPTWSPDGRRIAYERVSTGRRRVYLSSLGDIDQISIPWAAAQERIVGWTSAGTALLIERAAAQSGARPPEHSTWLIFV